MAHLLTGRNLAIGGAGIVGVALLSQSRTAQKIDPVRAPVQTNAVANVNKRFSAAGGTEKGTPAQAAPTTTDSKRDSRAEYSHENTVPSGGAAKAG